MDDLIERETLCHICALKKMTEASEHSHQDSEIDETEIMLRLLKLYTTYSLNIDKFNSMVQYIFNTIAIDLNIQFNAVNKIDQPLSLIKGDGQIVVFGNLKGFNRLLTKTILEYKGLTNRCCDIMRYTITLNTLGLNESTIRQKLINKFKTTHLGEDVMFKLGNIKPSKDNYFITHWVCLIHEGLDSLMKTNNDFHAKVELQQQQEELKKKRKIIGVEDEETLRPQYHRRIVKKLDETVVNCINLKDENSKPIYKNCISGDRMRFEIQFKFSENKEQTHFSYEWERLIIVDTQFQFNVQKIIISEMIAKCMKQDKAIRDEFLGKLRDLDKSTGFEEFNNKLLKHKHMIIDFNEDQMG